MRVGDLMAARGIYGLVWLDEELIVRARYGMIVNFMKIGAPVTESAIALLGLEDDIRALKTTPDRELRLPSVSAVTAEGSGPRLNFIFHHFAGEPYYLVIVAPTVASPFETQLGHQIRARYLAEADAAAKSKQLARANAELTAANSNLEHFAAIVSHDLKAPMRALRYMADDVESAIDDGDMSAARLHLEQLRRQSQRMSSMLSALLHYSSAGRQRDSLETIDTLHLVTEIVSSLPHGGMKVEVRGSWPVLETLAAPLDVALRNLIENTFKHHDRAHGHLLITCEDAEDALRITLEDDGPGIAPGDQESIFLPFRTLKGQGEGMGLAIVQKMIDAVGGTITLASYAPRRRGSIFTLRWPKRIAL